MRPNRVHIIAPANPLGPEAARFGFRSIDTYVAFAREHLPRPLRLTCSLRVLKAVEREFHGGRNDDRLRIADLQGALSDPRTLAIVATNGGAYFARILPHLDFSPLARRTAPLYAMGFSEITGLVNLVASFRCGRGLYWLNPNYLVHKIQPAGAAREALAEFWRTLPAVLNGAAPADTTYVPFGPIEGRLASGRLRPGPVRVVGGCLSVLAAVAGGEIGRRIRPRGHWLAIEDIKETPYRIDRFLATLKIAGWFERCVGVLVGDFRSGHTDTQPAVLELLRYHLPDALRTPVVTTRSFGHTWPLVPLPINQPLSLGLRRGNVCLAPVEAG
ncbi:MAG: LD-carboxypeptidase [Phycisphaerales bacterium]|nr:LD-carboxypeptidase [Phycisphaerales bacterium]